MTRFLAAIATLSLISCATASRPAEQEDAPLQQVDAAPPIDAPIDTIVCNTQPCDIQTQCGCATPEACDIDFSDLVGTACRPKVDTGVEGTSCGGTFGSPQKCAAKYVCLGNGTDRSCERYCKTTADCLAPRGQCVLQITGNGQPIPDAVTCTSNCDPASATNALCPASWTCDLFTATFNAAPYKIADCRVAGAAGQGATCSATVACAAGMSCITQGTAMKCAKICKPPANTGCPGATTCMSFGTPFTIAGTEYGACL
ncbi:hypothetical protein BH11MYX3_BH11MYX3_27880 [soil metagenome]